MWKRNQEQQPCIFWKTNVDTILSITIRLRGFVKCYCLCYNKNIKLCFSITFHYGPSNLCFSQSSNLIPKVVLPVTIGLDLLFGAIGSLVNRALQEIFRFRSPKSIGTTTGESWREKRSVMSLINRGLKDICEFKVS